MWEDKICQGLTVQGRSITTIAQAEALFGRDNMVWQPWDGDYDCDLSPRPGFGPHAPRPTDCLCYVDVMATADRAGYLFHDLPNSSDDGDHECFYWSALTPAKPPVPNWAIFGFASVISVFCGFGLCLGLLTYLDSPPSSDVPVTTDRFRMPIPERKIYRGLKVPIYRYLCPELPPEVGACMGDDSKADL
jgi:hypothetical protein